MQTSRRTSRVSALAAMALAAVTAIAGCSSSAPPAATQVPAASAAAVGADDIQILSALALTKEVLDGSFPGQTWQVWSPSDADKDRIAFTGLAACKADIDLSKATQSSAEYFLPTAPAAPATTSATTSSNKHPTASTTTTPAPTVLKMWVGSVAAVFANSADAKKALNAFGSFPSGDPQCAGPSDAASTKTYVAGPGPVQNTWYGSKAMTIVVDTKQKVAMSAVAQVRGRFVVVVYTVGVFSVTSTNYYVLQGSDATNNAAAAATQLLSQLTNEVVNGG